MRQKSEEFLAAFLFNQSEECVAAVPGAARQAESNEFCA